MASKSSRTLSRRNVLKTVAAAAVGGGAAALIGAEAMGAQGSAPAIRTGSQAGRKFRALVKWSADPASIQEVTLRPISGRQIVVRTEAAQACYTLVNDALLRGNSPQRATIMGHGGVGIVEAVGPQVIRIQVGDRVLVNQRAQCGSCYNCLRMRADKCLISGGSVELVPTADMGSTPVFSPLGGFADLMVVHEEQAVPVFTSVAADQLAQLNCVSNCGLATTMTLAPIEVASDVVVFGAGPVGLSAIQGARIKGASQIIVVEPIRYRRELALKLGATTALDPNVEGENLVKHIQELCTSKIAKTDRRWAGGGNIGPDHIIEAVGGDRLPPKTEKGPDPTGVQVLQQCWDLGSQIGTIVTTSVGHPTGAKVQIPASQWADGAKHHLPGTMGGCNPRRDSPRFIRLIETGQFDMKSISTSTFPLDRAKDAFQAAADRTTVSASVVFRA
jgi:S-(hydroxymethyl)glutathione dehydrogenase/alcohol dehydrogenase